MASPIACEQLPQKIIMLSTMLTSLKKGELPDMATLQGRLRAALVKKTAMLHLPRPFRHNDEKINPNSHHILWAAILLDDHPSQILALDLLLIEALDKPQAKNKKITTKDNCQNRIFQQSCQELLSLSSHHSLKTFVSKKLKKLIITKT